LPGTARGEDATLRTTEYLFNRNVPVAFDSQRQVAVERHRGRDDAPHEREFAQLAMKSAELQRCGHQPDFRDPARRRRLDRMRKIGRIDRARIKQRRSRLQCEHRRGLESEHVLRRNRAEDGRAIRRRAERA